MKTSQTQTLRLERLFDCTPDELFDAWTRAEEFARWISPLPDSDAEVLVFEPHPGGRLVFVMACPLGEGQREEGWFEVVNRPHELVIYQPHEGEGPLQGYPLTMRVTFEAVGEQTRLVLEQSGFPAALSLDGPTHGMTAVLGKLAAVVAR